MAHALFPTHLYSFHGPIPIGEQRPSLETSTRQTNDRLEFSGRLSLKTAPKRPFLDTKSAVEWLKTAQSVFVFMRLCSPVGLNYLDGGFALRCGRKDFWTACCFLLRALEQ